MIDAVILAGVAWFLMTRACHALGNAGRPVPPPTRRRLRSAASWAIEGVLCLTGAVGTSVAIWLIALG